MASLCERRSRSVYPPCYEALSKSEHQVAHCAASGSSNRDIATSLEITQETVEKPLTRIFAKLGVGSRAQRVRYIVSKDVP